MHAQTLTWRRLFGRLLAGLSAPLLLPLAAGIAAGQSEDLLPPFTPEPVAVQAPAQAPVPHAVQVLHLAQCVQIALERQPALAAYRADVKAAQDGLIALEDLRLADRISHELPIRKQQASLGIAIAEAGAMQAEWETIYAVTRNYISVQYARAQQKALRDIIGTLKSTHQTAQDQLKGGTRRDLTEEQVDQIAAYQLLAESRLNDAERGEDRAMMALREAMGGDPDCCYQVAPSDLPEPPFTLSCADVVALALARRGELVQAADFAEVVRLEVDAQATSCHLTFRTFAAAVDIHARPIPAGEHNSNYRPEAVGPAMPVTLAGKKCDRVARAQDFADRAAAVVEKTRNLIVLEVQDSYLKYREAAAKIPKTREAAGKAANILEANNKGFRSQQKTTVRDILDAAGLQLRSRTDYNDALYQYLLALADLQRETAGGYCLGLDGQAGRGAAQQTPAGGR